MKGLKFLFKSWIKMPFFFWFSIIFSAAFLVLPFVLHEEVGSEDYLAPKMFLFFPSMFMSELGLICGCRDIAANKLVRSFPIAKELYTRSVPAFVMLITLGISAVSVGAYFIFLGIIGAEAVQFSDVLIIGAIICFSQLLVSSFLTTMLGGGVLAVYFVAAPMVAITVMDSKNLTHSGFGVPVWAAVLIFVAAAAAGTVLLFAISARRYKTLNVKINNNAINYATK